MYYWTVQRHNNTFNALAEIKGHQGGNNTSHTKFILPRYANKPNYFTAHPRFISSMKLVIIYGNQVVLVCPREIKP
jgi:hypothetical protein